jgi:hypothetical protein
MVRQNRTSLRAKIAWKDDEELRPVEKQFIPGSEVAGGESLVAKYEGHFLAFGCGRVCSRD